MSVEFNYKNDYIDVIKQQNIYKSDIIVNNKNSSNRKIKDELKKKEAENTSRLFYTMLFQYNEMHDRDGINMCGTRIEIYYHTQILASFDSDRLCNV